MTSVHQATNEPTHLQPTQTPSHEREEVRLHLQRRPSAIHQTQVRYEDGRLPVPVCRQATDASGQTQEETIDIHEKHEKSTNTEIDENQETKNSEIGAMG